MLRPPIGVAILGFFSVVAGISYLLSGLHMSGFVVFGPGETGSGILFWGLLTILAGIGFVLVGVALWTLQAWGWLFANIMAILGLLDAVFVLIATGSLTYGLAVALLPAVILWYLNAADIKTAFRADTSATL